MRKEVVFSPDAPAAIGPYSQAIAVETTRLVFLSGQICLNTDGELVGGDDISSQTRQVMDNLGNILKAAGLEFENVVKTTIFLTNLGDYAAVNAVYGKYFRDAPPARAAIQVSALPKGVGVEIECIAAR